MPDTLTYFNKRYGQDALKEKILLFRDWTPSFRFKLPRIFEMSAQVMHREDVGLKVDES